MVGSGSSPSRALTETTALSDTTGPVMFPIIIPIGMDKEADEEDVVILIFMFNGITNAGVPVIGAGAAFVVAFVV